MSQAIAKPLGRTQRRVLVAIALYRRGHGQGPPWHLLRQSLGIEQSELNTRLHSLRRQGLVTFTWEPGSLATTEQGLRATP